MNIYWEKDNTQYGKLKLAYSRLLEPDIIVLLRNDISGSNRGIG